MTDYSNILNYLNQKIGLNIDSIGFITLESCILNTMKEFNTNNINHLLDLIQNDYEKFLYPKYFQKLKILVKSKILYYSKRRLKQYFLCHFQHY